MAQATLVKMEKTNSDGSIYFMVMGDENAQERYIKVISYTYGWAIVEPLPCEYIDDFAEVICGCFEKGSNFHKELNKAYGKNSAFKGIDFSFNEVLISVTKKNCDKETVIENYRKGAKTKKKSTE